MVVYGPPAMFAPPPPPQPTENGNGETNEKKDEEKKQDNQPSVEPAEDEKKQDNQPSAEPAEGEKEQDNQPSTEPAEDEKEQDNQPSTEPPSGEGGAKFLMIPAPEGYGPSNLSVSAVASDVSPSLSSPTGLGVSSSLSSPSSPSSISSPSSPVILLQQFSGVPAVGESSTRMSLAEALKTETPIILRAEQDPNLNQLVTRYQALVEQLLSNPEAHPELRDLAIQVSRLHEGGRSGPPFSTEPMTLGHFLQRHYGDDTRCYLQQLPIHEFAPLLAYFGDKVREVPFGIGARDLLCGMFAGGRGITTSLHYDRKHFAQGEAPVSNIFVQVSGTKTFELIHPEHSQSLYARGLPLSEAACQPGSTGLEAAGTPEDTLPAPIATSPHVSRLSKLDPATCENPEATSAWPGFAEAYRQRAVVQLSPGDCLYVPPRWWHSTSASTPGTALNWWFTPLSSPQ